MVATAGFLSIMVRWVVGSILQCRSIKLFLVPASVGMCCPVSGMMYIKDPFAANNNQ